MYKAATCIDIMHLQVHVDTWFLTRCLGGPTSSSARIEWKSSLATNSAHQLPITVRLRSLSCQLVMEASCPISCHVNSRPWHSVGATIWCGSAWSTTPLLPHLQHSDTYQPQSASDSVEEGEAGGRPSKQHTLNRQLTDPERRAASSWRSPFSPTP